MRTKKGESDLDYRTLEIQWIEVLDAAAILQREEKYLALLYTGLESGEQHRSFLFWNPRNRFQWESWRLPEWIGRTQNDKGPPAFVGYLGYGLKNSLETVKRDDPSFITTPSMDIIEYNIILEWDHRKRTVRLHYHHELSRTEIAGISEKLKSEKAPDVSRSIVPPKRIDSNMSRAAYLENVKNILNHIRRGDLYQANLTRKFYGTWDENPDPWNIFLRLCEASPAPYSAYFRHDDLHILSSSPELFMKLNDENVVRTEPIKGTMKRSSDPHQDDRNREILRNSEKNRAENLMIADLMRNDLGRGCIPGSVRAVDLFRISSYAHIHHMSSVIEGTLRGDVSLEGLLGGAFPPGSMTGAPKIRAMNICSELERQSRGIYSGALGWFAPDGCFELSVVIRTIIIKNNKFEFQAGGGIVFDSDPEEELDESLDKARGMAVALGIDMDVLRNL